MSSKVPTKLKGQMYFLEQDYCPKQYQGFLPRSFSPNARTLNEAKIIVKFNLKYNIYKAFAFYQSKKEIEKTCIFPTKASTMVWLLIYPNKTQGIEKHRWPKLIVEERLDKRKNAWMKQNAKCMKVRNVNMHECPNNNDGIKKL